MSIFELILLAIGLSMDAFAVSICKGLATKKVKIKHLAIAGLWFGGFQALMPLLGYLLGSTFAKYITSVDHWVAFILLSIIGGNMLKEGFSNDNEEEIKDNSFGFKTMFLMAIATSIDALAIGVTFAFLPNVDIKFAVCSIGLTTFLFSAIGVKIGSVFGDKFESKAEIVGGFILICIGLKVLIEHLFFS